MVSLRMKGRQISNLARFYESFDLEQLLLQRQAFLAFANACLQLFDLDEYVVKVFSAANEKKDEIVKDAGSAFLDDFWNNPFGFALKDAAFEDALKRQREPEPNSAEEERNRLVHSVFQALGEAKMENGAVRILATGINGHAAYPETARNAIGQLLITLKELGATGPIATLALAIGTDSYGEGLGIKAERVE